MIKVEQISEEDVPLYSSRLDQLVRSTINLPSEALDYYSAIWTEERVGAQLNNMVLLMATSAQGVLGLVLGTGVEGGVGTIIWVVVDNRLQRTGVGSLLFKKACECYKAKGAHKVKLTVPDSQTVQFYEKQGMKLEGHHQNHWWQHDFWAMGISI